MKYTPETLITAFEDYIRDYGFEEKRKKKTKRVSSDTNYIEEDVIDSERRYQVVTITDFQNKIKVGANYFHNLDERYSSAKDICRSMSEMHINKGIAIGDIPPNYGMFILKNWFKYTDFKQVEAKVETTNTNDVKALENKLNALSEEDLISLLEDNETK
jgi:hypothetical protein